MFRNDSDKIWKCYGEIDPYYGVLSADEYRLTHLDVESKQRFFRSGNEQIERIFRIVRERVDPNFYPRSAVDFGCGVGRLTIPLARICQTVTGIDISEAMLREAERNSKEQNILNVAYVLSDDELSRVSGTFDFINSQIVFQHIPVQRGEAIMKKLIGLLTEGGVGALHFTYNNRRPLKQRVSYTIYKWFPFLNQLRLLIKRMPIRPLMQMNEYDLNRLFRILQEAGCHNVYIRFTNHNQFYGVIIFFQKERRGVPASL